jgi:hypothetical protein
MSNKTITIQQGTGDDALEMTVQVTQEELNKMEEIRSKDPSAWEGRGLDLVKAAKDAIFEEIAQPNNRTNWKLVLGIALGVLAIIGTIIFSGKSKDKEPEVSQQNPNEYIHNLWLLSSQNGYKRDEKYLKEELIKSVGYRKLFYDKLKAEEPNFVEDYSDFEKHWLYDVLSEPIYGLNLGTPKEFDSLLDNNEESRRWLWEKANECDLDVGKDFDEFWSLIAPESYYSLQNGNKPSSTSTIQRRRKLYDGLTAYGCNLGDFESFSQKLDNEAQRRNFYDSISEYFNIGSWEDFTNAVNGGISTNDNTSKSIEWKYVSSKQYDFTYQYDDNEFKLVDKIKKDSHCVMKLQSPVDDFKSILVSVWDNSEFPSSYDSDFISSCQSVDEGMGKVISSAVKSKIDGVNALKSELIISPMGKSYYAAIYRIIHKKRMYMLNIYIPTEEYNKDKSYGEKCANNFKFN